MIDTQMLIYLFFGVSTIYVLYPEKVKNLLIMTFKRKDYVICHVFRTSTRKPVTIFAVPDQKNEYQTRIWKKKTYNLKPEHANFIDNGRLHYLLLEESNMPLTAKDQEVQKIDDRQIIINYRGKLYVNTSDNLRALKFEPWTKNEVLIYSDEVDTGINAKSHNVLHGSQTQIALILAGLAILISLIGLYLSYTQIQEISPLVHVIYEKVQPSNINITVPGK